jgi:hypothetical protein
MGSFAEISDVGETLKKLLQDNMDNTFGSGVVTVTPDSPKKIEDDGSTENKLLSVFLYRIIENGDSKNRPTFPISSTEIASKPLVVDLYYMITAYGADDDNRSRILGRGMQILYENPILLGVMLQKQLEGTSEEIRVSFNPMTQEMITQVWQAMEVSMRVSAFYLVTPVMIESAPVKSAERIKERELRET